jgi:anti-anti-sigma factor
VILVELEGEIDSSKVLDQIRKKISEYEAENIAILMQKVTYINSSGCGGLVALHHAMEANGLHLFVVEPTDNVIKVLKQIGCDRVLHVVDSLQDVIESAGSTAVPA